MKFGSRVNLVLLIPIEDDRILLAECAVEFRARKRTQDGVARTAPKASFPSPARSSRRGPYSDIHRRTMTGCMVLAAQA